jgi:hypothetical protein
LLDALVTFSELARVRERLLDRGVDLALDLLVGDLDVLLGGLLLDPVAADEELEDLVAQLVVLLLALALQLRLRRLGDALAGRRRGRLLVGDALREVRGIRQDDLGRARLAGIRLALLRDGGDLHPVVEGRLLDRLVADLDDRVAGNSAPARADEQRGEHKKGAERQRAVLLEHDVTLVD